MHIYEILLTCAARAPRLQSQTAATELRRCLFLSPGVLFQFFPQHFCVGWSHLSPCPPCPLQSDHVTLTFSQDRRWRLSQLQPLLTISSPPPKGSMVFQENPDKEGAVVEQQASTTPLCRVLIFSLWWSEASQFEPWRDPTSQRWCRFSSENFAFCCCGTEPERWLLELFQRRLITPIFYRVPAQSFLI